MLNIFFRSALRHLLRHKVQTLINIASLAIGLAVFGFAFLYIYHELSYDDWPDNARVHRLLVEQRGIPGVRDSMSNTVPSRAWPNVVDYFANHFESATRISAMSVLPTNSEITQSTPLVFVDSAFADIFQMEVIEGDIRRVLSGPGYVALEEHYAERIGYDVGVGERLRLSSGRGGGEVEYEVGAIYRLPLPVSPAVNFELLTLMHEYSHPIFGESRIVTGWDNFVQIWLKFKPGVTAESFNAQQPAFIQQTETTYNDALGSDRRISDHLFYTWQPLSEMHFNPTPDESTNGRLVGDSTRVVTFAITGVLVLLVGCSNSVSLSLAAALERRREIGVRKAAGALQADILWHHLAEAVLLALLALVPAIAALELLQDAFQTLLPFTARIDIGWNEYGLMMLVASAVGLACGFYPAFVLAGTRPQVALKAGAQESAKGTLGLRSLLVGVQFSLASLLLIATAALYLQLAVTRTQPLGYEPDNTIFLSLPPDRQAQAAGVMRAELEKMPGIAKVIPAMIPPSTNSPFGSNVSALTRNRGDRSDIKATPLFVDFGFAGFMGIGLVAGRDFDPLLDTRPPLDPNAPSEEWRQWEERILLNQAAARALGFMTPEEAVDQTVFRRTTDSQDGKVLETPQRIIGVVADSMYTSLRRRPGPEIYQSMPPAMLSIGTPFLVKYDDAAEASIQQTIRDATERILGAPVQNMRFVEEQIKAEFVQEQNESRLLLICGGVALLLSCIGLYGLVAFSMERRVKEIGVRKALGASSGSIVMLFLLRFSSSILIASLVAWPIAMYFILQWIERFPYQMERAWLLPLCLGTTVVVLVIAILTVWYITARAAAINPVRSLRYE